MIINFFRICGSGVKNLICRDLGWRKVIVNFCLKKHKIRGITISAVEWIQAGYGEINIQNFYLACQGGDYQRMMKNGANFYYYGLLGACEGNNNECINEMYNMGANLDEECLKILCKNLIP